MVDSSVYDSLASVLSYPDAGFDAALDYCGRGLAAADPRLRGRFEEWAARMRAISPEEREEAYAQAFDLSPKCTLELGWHLFGESYDRGMFLVWMRGRLRDASLAETTDLPDHARHVLAVLGRMRREEADRFSTACVLPAMEIIRDGLRGNDSFYAPLIDMICDWLQSRHGESARDLDSLPILSQHEELLRAEGV